MVAARSLAGRAVAVGVLGAVIVAPSGFSEFVRKIIAGVRRFIPSKPKSINVSAGAASAFATAMQGYAHVGMPTSLAEHDGMTAAPYLVPSLFRQTPTSSGK
jgi:hypothetical protein